MESFELIMGFGTFDAVHPGHHFYLAELKKRAKKLVVVIARDESVKRIKGKSPLFVEQERLEAIKKLGIADEVVLGDLHDHYKVIRNYRPQAIGLGYDQRLNLKEFQSLFPEIQIVRMESHHPEKYKSSLLKEQLLKDGNSS